MLRLCYNAENKNQVLGDAVNIPSAANLNWRSAMGSIPARHFYVYVLCRPDKNLPQGKPFYVGKGQGQRVYNHDYEARSGHKCPKCSVIRKVWREGGTVLRYIIFTTDDEQEAFAYEVETIALYGRKNLTNLTDGGEGPSGMVMGPKTLARMSEVSKRMWEDPAMRARLTEAPRGRRASPETRAKQSAALTGRVRSAEHCASIAAVKAQEWMVTDPDGHEYVVSNLKAFCRDQALSYSNLAAVARGKHRHAGGWKCRKR